MLARYICFCFERKVTPEELEKANKERIRMLTSVYRPGIVHNY